MKTMVGDEVRAAQGRYNRVMVWISNVLGLTTGIGVIAWGVWSLIMTVGLSIYERTSMTGMSLEELLIEDTLNQGLLQSAMLIALGVMIIELRRLRESLSGESDSDEI